MLRALFGRLRDPDWTRRSLDFFFVKALCRYHAVAFAELRQVYAQYGWLTLEMETTELRVPGSLDQFQGRLPAGFHRVNQNLIVAQRCLFSNTLPLHPN
jgi:hypothetical protein